MGSRIRNDSGPGGTNATGFIYLNILVMVILMLVIANLLTSIVRFESSSSKATVIFEDDFEHSKYVQVQGYTKGILDGLADGDDSFGNAYEWDHWGVTGYRYHEGHGNKSLWCAYYGQNYLNGNISNILIHKFDWDMFAYWETNYSFANYDRVTLSFWYWSETNFNPANHTPSEYLTVLAWNGTGTGGAGFKTLWKQTTNATWTHVTINIPTSEVLVGFYFISPENRSHPLLEGAYIDDVLFTGYNDPTPEHYFYIDVANVNDPTLFYGGNLASNGGLPLNISFNGTLHKSVFLMPEEKMRLTVNFDSLPITLNLRAPGINSTFQLTMNNTKENGVYSYTIESKPV